MAVDNLLVRLIAMFGKGTLSNRLSQYDPPSRGDILHDGLVGAGKTWGGILGTAAGITGGQAVGGPYGATAGALALGPAGNLAGGWAAHGAYLQGLLINDILTHPENWTVDAAGAIVPAMDGGPPERASGSGPSFAGRFGNWTASQAGTALARGEADELATGAADSVRPAGIRRLTRVPPTGR